jgi:dipeptidyl aminopeptidase/acylaminoacyl peptidase
MTAKTAPHGSWKSPFSAKKIAATAIRFEDIALDGETVYWSERRPLEGGRYVIARWTEATGAVDALPAPFSARTRVHEYGGGAFTAAGGTIYFINDEDQRVYRLAEGREPEPLTPHEDVWHADFAVDSRRERLIAVREDRSTGAAEAVTTIAEIWYGESHHGTNRILVEGNDFYASPRVSPDGSQVAWLAWNHPNMPWDGCELWLGTLGDDGAIESARIVAGGATESIFQPAWSPSGVLHFVSDRTGWWNLFRLDGDSVSALKIDEAEYGQPLWVFTQSTYAFLDEGRLVAASVRNGRWRLSIIESPSGSTMELTLPSTVIGKVHAENGVAVFEAASPVEESAIVRMDGGTSRLSVLAKSSNEDLDRGFLSVPGAVEFPTSGGRSAYGFFYPPQNSDFQAPDGELPPLIVLSHGGPTSAALTSLNLGYQYWTSRGFAVLDVDYGGSTGYGRDYRQRLQGQWGIVDVDDCENGAKHLVSEGLVDPERLIIQGRSASGYTTLATLAFRDTFKAGVSFYGVADLETLLRDTHKFESRYLDGLIGPYPERRDLYVERSPIHYVDQISCPLILFQGLEDKVVPPNQAQMMFDAVNAKGLPVALVMFEGEQHGFRRAENIERSLEAELYFLSRVFGFEPADAVEPVEIANL